MRFLIVSLGKEMSTNRRVSSQPYPNKEEQKLIKTTKSKGSLYKESEFISFEGIDGKASMYAELIE